VAAKAGTAARAALAKIPLFAWRRVTIVHPAGALGFCNRTADRNSPSLQPVATEQYKDRALRPASGHRQDFGGRQGLMASCLNVTGKIKKQGGKQRPICSMRRRMSASGGKTDVDQPLLTNLDL
jgi:hypothetical protein